MKKTTLWLLLVMTTLLLVSCSDNTATEPEVQIIKVPVPSNIATPMDSVTNSMIDSVNADLSLFVFSHSTPTLDTLKVGHIMASGVSKVFTEGYLRKVTNIERRDNKIFVQTVQGSISDLFIDGSTKFDLKMSYDMIDSVIVPAGSDVKIVKGDEKSGFDFTIDAEQPWSSLIKSKQTLKVQCPVDFSMDFKPFKCRFFATPKMEMEAGLEIGRSADDEIEKKFPICKIVGKPITFTIGIIPVVIRPVLNFEVNGEIEAQAGLVFTVNKTFEQIAGFTYQNKQLTHECQNIEHPVEFDYKNSGFNGSLRIEPMLTLDAELYGIKGPYLYAGRYLEVEAALNFNSLQVKGFIGNRLGCGIRKAEILEDLVEASLDFDIYDEKTQILNYTYQPSLRCFITEPADKIKVTPGDVVNIKMSAERSDDAEEPALKKLVLLIDNVEKQTYYPENSSVISMDKQFNWNTTGVASGVHKLTAIVYNNDEISAKAEHTVIIRKSKPPVCSFISPSDNSMINNNTDFFIKVNATDQDGSISYVNCFVGSLLGGAGWPVLPDPTQGGFTFKYNTGLNLGYEKLVFTAIATDNSGELSEPVKIFININKAPIITIATPQNGTVHEVGCAVAIRTDVSDPNDNIKKVEFYVDNTLFKTFTAPPFIANWTAGTLGNHAIKVKALDQNNLSDEKEVSIKVIEQTSKGFIKGIVYDAVTNSALSNATVDVRKNGVIIAQEATNIQGQYSIQVPVYGSYVVNFSKSGYQQVNYQSVSVELNTETILEPVMQIDNNHAGVGSISGKIFNGLTNAVVGGVSIKLRAGINSTVGNVLYQTISGSDGSYSISNVISGNYTAEISKNEFIKSYFSILCIGGQNNTGQNAFITPELDDEQIRIILSWGENPPDLDTHLTGPIPASDQRFHIMYNNENYYYNNVLHASLDVDVTNSYGPETATIHNQTTGMYRYSVHDYTNRNSTNSNALSNSGAQVRVYKGSQLIRMFNVPNNTGGIVWTVFEMNGNSITPINSVNYNGEFKHGIDYRKLPVKK